MSIYKRGKTYWYKFNWNGEQVRESTKQGNPRTARQIEAAHKTSLAKGEVGIRERKRIPTLREFAEVDFLPYVESHFEQKPTTIAYYKNRTGHLIKHADLANCPLDQITRERITGFVAKHREQKYEVSSTNRCLQVLRRMFHLAIEWGKTEKALPRISLLPGEKRRERVLSFIEEEKYLKAASAVGDQILADYRRALTGIRATQRDQKPFEPADTYLLRDVATVLLDCGLRPEECYRLRWEHVREGSLHIPFGKTKNARRTIPLPQRSGAVLDMREAAKAGPWVFPAATQSGHIEQSTLRRSHAAACKLGGLAHFPLYTMRHTCLTRWSAHMDPYTLAYLAGHGDFGTTKRYVHPLEATVREAMVRVQQTGHRSGHKVETPKLALLPDTAANV